MPLFLALFSNGRDLPSRWWEKCDYEEKLHEMVVMDAVMADVDRHAGNYGFLVDSDTGDILRMAPLFDQNMACLPMMMEHDNFDEHISLIGSKSVTISLSPLASSLLTISVQSL